MEHNATNSTKICFCVLLDAFKFMDKESRGYTTEFKFYSCWNVDLVPDKPRKMKVLAKYKHYIHTCRWDEFPWSMRMSGDAEHYRLPVSTTR